MYITLLFEGRGNQLHNILFIINYLWLQIYLTILAKTVRNK
jgi:hypothetical protein